MKRKLAISLALTVMLVALAIPARSTATPQITCAEARLTCDATSWDWYMSCIRFDDFDCYCRYQSIKVSCMNAHGCPRSIPWYCNPL